MKGRIARSHCAGLYVGLIGANEDFVSPVCRQKYMLDIPGVENILIVPSKKEVSVAQRSDKRGDQLVLAACHKHLALKVVIREEVDQLFVAFRMFWTGQHRHSG